MRYFDHQEEGMNQDVQSIVGRACWVIDITGPGDLQPRQHSITELGFDCISIPSDTTRQQQSLSNTSRSRCLPHVHGTPRRQSTASPSPSTMSSSPSSAPFVFPITRRPPNSLQVWEPSMSTRSPTMQANSQRQWPRKAASSCPCTVSASCPH